MASLQDSNVKAILTWQKNKYWAYHNVLHSLVNLYSTVHSAAYNCTCIYVHNNLIKIFISKYIVNKVP